MVHLGQENVRIHPAAIRAGKIALKEIKEEEKILIK
jgi:hypothetical protein